MAGRTSKQGLIYRIVEAEWKMFAVVPNEGGKAACQEDYRTFECCQSAKWDTF